MDPLDFIPLYPRPPFFSLFFYVTLSLSFLSVTLYYIPRNKINNHKKTLTSGFTE